MIYEHSTQELSNCRIVTEFRRDLPLVVTVEVTNPDWTPTQVFMDDVLIDAKKDYPQARGGNVNWVRVA